MATAYAYTLSKRHNSTLQPTGAGTSIDVQLKGGCDILAPIFVLNMSSVAFNYIQFGARYYFVTGIKSVRQDLWEVSCAVDVLATWKSAIQAMNPYVLYYTHNNTEIADKRLSTKTAKTVDINTGAFDILGNGTGSNYAVIVNTIGEGACDSYAMSQSDARTLLSNLDNWFNDENDSGIYTDLDDGIFDWSDVENAIKSFLQETLFFWKQWFATGKVADNLRSAYVLPLPVAAISGNSHHVHLGQYTSDVEATRVYDRIFSDGASVTIPWQASDWRRNSPYHELYLYIPYVGLISLSPSDLIGDTTINVSVSIDVTCGDAVFSVYTGTNRFIGQYTANMAAPFAIGSSNTPITAQINTVVGASVAAAAAIASGGGTAVLGAMTGGALSLANNISGQPTCIGSNMGGAVLGLTDNIVCYSIFHDTTVSPSSVSSEKGTPYNATLSLSGVTGYVQTAGASVAGAMTDTEREQINELMNGGIYIE